MTGPRHQWDYHGAIARYARRRDCQICGAEGSRFGPGSTPWSTTLGGKIYMHQVPPCPGKPPEQDKARQSPPPQVIDLTGVPSDVAWSAEILVPGGTVRVYAGMVEVRTGRRVSIVEIEPQRNRGYVTEAIEKVRGPEIVIKEDR